MKSRSEMMSRREFSLALASAALVPYLNGAAPQPRFGLTSYQWGSDWDLPTLIANCIQAKALGLELRTRSGYKHGVEVETDDSKRREVKKTFSGSPVTLVGIASPLRFDWPDSAKLQTEIESAKAHVRLAHDVGASGVRVFPNDFHADVPQQTTIEQIARSLNSLGKFASDYGQMIRLENHGKAGRLVTLHEILSLVDQKNVVIKLNGDARDAEGGAFAHNFALVADRLGDTLHMRNLGTDKFPYQLQWDLLIARRWAGWCLVERSDKVADRVRGLVEEREVWEKMIAEAQQKFAERQR